MHMYGTKRIEGHHGRGLGERQDACASISVLQCTASQHTTEGRMSEHTSLSEIPFLLSCHASVFPFVLIYVFVFLKPSTCFLSHFFISLGVPCC